MVQIVENHAEISCQPLRREADPERPGFVRLTVRIEQASPLPPWPNMFERYQGQEIVLLARADTAAAKVVPGGKAGSLHLRVRMAGPGLAFVEE